MRNLIVAVALCLSFSFVSDVNAQGPVRNLLRNLTCQTSQVRVACVPVTRTRCERFSNGCQVTRMAVTRTVYRPRLVRTCPPQPVCCPRPVVTCCPQPVVVAPVVTCCQTQMATSSSVVYSTPVPTNTLVDAPTDAPTETLATPVASPVLENSTPAPEDSSTEDNLEDEASELKFEAPSDSILETEDN